MNKHKNHASQRQIYKTHDDVIKWKHSGYKASDAELWLFLWFAPE